MYNIQYMVSCHAHFSIGGRQIRCVVFVLRGSRLHNKDPFCIAVQCTRLVDYNV